MKGGLDDGAYLGICKIALRMPEVSSLKGKRQIVKKIVERTKNRFNVSGAEVGSLNNCREAVLCFVTAGNEGAFVNSVADKVLAFIENTCLAEISDFEIEVIKL